MALLETKGDYDFSRQLTASLRKIGSELEKLNSRTEISTLYKLVKKMAETDISADVSDEMNRVYADCQNLKESMERAGLTDKEV